MNFKYDYETPIGTVILLSNDQWLLGLWFEDQAHLGAQYDLADCQTQMTRPIELAINWLNQYFAGKHPQVETLPLLPVVTEFRQRVLAELLKVPYGRTTTYLAISNQLQANQGVKRNLARAVGGAIGHNPIAIIIPCHRIIGRKGQLTGYAGGLSASDFYCR